MAEESIRIRLLPDEVRTKISSSCKITSGESVIEGLFTNALDADARSIVIDADFARGCITCCDDGTGINEVEFSEQGNLIKSHCTSRFNALHPTYGRHGRFLSNLSFICLLSMSSQHRCEPSANRLVLHRGVSVIRQVGKCKEEVGLTRQGTRVMVYNLFGDVPVRFKQMSLRYSSSSETERVFGRVTQMLVSYLLACPRPVELRFALKSERQHSFRCSSSSLTGSHFALESMISLMFQAKFLSTLDRQQWRSASVRTSHFSIRAAISTEPSPSKAAQFISVGLIPIRRGQGAAVLFDIINSLFEASSFGLVNDDSDITGGHRNLNTKVAEAGQFEKGVEKWPMFYLRIDPKSQQTPLLLEQDELSADEVPMVGHLTKALESLISHFLATAGFARRPKTREPRSGFQNARKADSIARLHPQPLHSELSRNATEARFLSHWHRVKSARPSNQDFRYGLPLDESTKDLDLSEDRAYEDLPLDVSYTHQFESPKTDATMQIEVADAADSVAEVPWTNPRNGQVLRLNPRTGAIMPATRRVASGSGRCYAPSSAFHQQSSDHSPSHLLADSVKPRARTFANNLQKYLGTMNSVQQRETRIVNASIEELSAMNGYQPVAGPGNTATAPSQAVTRHALSAAIVVRQVDQKFVLAVVPVQRECDDGGGEKRLLVLVDQHAADERIRFEKLCQELCNGSSTFLPRPLVFEVDETEARLLEERKALFQAWCIDYNLIEDPYSSTIRIVEINTLPNLVAERCRAEPKLLIDLVRRELWSGRVHSHGLAPSMDPDTRSWWSRIANCPKGLVEMLKSRSCRTAIMFNDVLDAGQCRKLVQALARCSFPFQCAHGRPTLTVLADLEGTNGMALLKSRDPGTCDFAFGYGEAWSDWMDLD